MPRYPSGKFPCVGCGRYYKTLDKLKHHLALNGGEYWLAKLDQNSYFNALPVDV